MPSKLNILIKVTNSKIWFNDINYVNNENTNLPIGDFKFVESRSIFWEAEMTQFNKENGNLSIRVINFRPLELSDFLHQKAKAEVKKLLFEDIFWPAFSADLSFYKKTSFLHLLSDNMPDTNLT